MKPLWLGAAAALVLVLGLLAWSSVDILGTSQIAVARGSVPLVLAARPGLFVHAPWTQVQWLEQRQQWLRVNGEQLGSGAALRIVDVGLDWRIGDVQRFLAAGGGSMQSGTAQLHRLLKQAVPALDLLHDMRQGAAALQTLREQAAQLGIVAGDPVLLRVELNESAATLAQQAAGVSIKARTDAINEQSSRESSTLRLAAEAERDALVAANARDAGRVRGAADAAAARIYARAYGKDPQFADFFRSLEAYRKVLGRDGDLLVITPDGDFFRYLQKPQSK